MGRPPLPVGTFGKIDFVTIDGRVRARAFFRDHDGATRQVTRHGRNRAEAGRRLRETLRDRTGPALTGRLSGRSRMHEAIDQWDTSLDDADLSPGTIETYRRSATNHVKPGMGQLRLDEVDVPAIERFLTRIRDRHGRGARRTAKNVLSLVLGHCVRHGAIDHNPVKEVAKASRGNRSRPRALTVVEQVELTKRVAGEACAHPKARIGDELDLADLVDTMLGTGCRIGETLALRRETLDLDAGVAEINATIIRLRGKGTVLQQWPKTGAGWRILALPQDLVELMRRRLATQAPTAGDPLVWVIAPDGQWRQVQAHELGLLFPAIGGGIRHPSNTQRGLRAVLNRIGGYEWVVPHTFRRTVATRLEEGGCTARQIADQLGHARPSMTQDLYMGRGVACAQAAQALQAK